MAEPTVICPNCKTELNLTESFVALPIEAMGRDLEQRLAQNEKLQQKLGQVTVEQGHKGKQAQPDTLGKQPDLDNAKREIEQLSGLV